MYKNRVAHEATLEDLAFHVFAVSMGVCSCKKLNAKIMKLNETKIRVIIMLTKSTSNTPKTPTKFFNANDYI